MVRTIKKAIAILMLCCLVFSGMTLFTACEDMDFSFEGRCVTSEDGFIYYEDSKIGLCIIALPDSEAVVIPEYIDGKQVKQLGYKDVGIGYMDTYTVDGSKVKIITIQHSITRFAVSFPNLEQIIFVDFLYCCIDSEYDSTSIGNYIGWSNSIAGADTKVELTSSDREFNLGSLAIKTINIPNYVVKIDSNSFNGISGLTLRTPHKIKPDGWAENWNGDNEVEWGVDLT